jgi:hypothetical protein
MGAVIQLLLIGVWGAAVGLHLRRLYRLAVVPVAADRSHFVRRKAQRMWWWLGRDEFWEALRRDTLRCLEATLMLALISLSL